MKNNEPKNIADFITHANKEARPLLKELRELIKDAVPDAEEGIWYSVPFYKYYGPLLGFNVATKQVSFGFGNDILSDVDRAQLKEQGYILGKASLQIKFDQKLPVAIIKKAVKAKARENKKNPGSNINLK